MFVHATPERCYVPDMSEPFVEMLRGATNTLGRTDEVTELVLANPDRVSEVYDLFFQDDEWVRLRAASASKRLWRADPDLFAPFIPRWIEKVSAIEQASSRWTFAQMCEECDDLLTNTQRDRATEIVVDYLATENDWIVLNSSMSTLTHWAKSRPWLAKQIRPDLVRLSGESRKSVAKRATKSLDQLSEVLD